MKLVKHVLTCVLGGMTNCMQHFLNAIRRVLCTRCKAPGTQAAWKNAIDASFACGVTDCAVNLVSLVLCIVSSA